MANKKKDDGSVELRIQLYPERYKSHKKLLDVLEAYQKDTGFNMRDVLIMLLCNGMISEPERMKDHESGEKEAPQPLFPDEPMRTMGGTNEADFFSGSL